MAGVNTLHVEGGEWGVQFPAGEMDGAHLDLRAFRTICRSLKDRATSENNAFLIKNSGTQYDGDAISV